MTQPTQALLRNALLRAMQPDDFARLACDLTFLPLKRGEVLSRPGVSIEHVYFPEGCIGSVVAISSEGERVEANLFGCDGMSGVPVILGAETSPHEYVVQVEDGGHRMPASALLGAFRESEPLRDLLLRYVHIVNIQTGHTALANAIYSIDQRLARWLLMCHDRLSTDTLFLTHDFLALMLGVRRPGVTTALHILEGHLLIRGERGRITIRDRAGLERFASDAYGAPEAEYDRLIGPLKSDRALPPIKLAVG